MGARAGDGAQGSQQAQPPSFSSSTVLVPVVVRALDKKTGRPVSDLRQEDLRLLEDGAPQAIRHFEHRTLTAEGSATSAAEPALRTSALGITPQFGRIILLVLGGGRLEEPFGALSALQKFVREQLLPQDHIAVLAYGRATDFTTDHEQVALVLERFKNSQAGVDRQVRNAMKSSSAAVYGGKALNASVRQKLDEPFAGIGTRQIKRSENESLKRAANDLQRAGDTQTRSDLHQMAQRMQAADPSGTPAGGLWSSFDELRASEIGALGLSGFLQIGSGSLADLGMVYSALDYMTNLEGDKHLVFVTERGLRLFRTEDIGDLTKAANDARVAIDTFQVGGIQGQNGGVLTDQFGQTFSFQALRLLAEETGGVSSVADNPAVAISRINDVSRSEYVLGFYPADSSLTGGYHKIEVRTTRKDVNLLYRRGYYGRKELPGFNRRDAVTKERLLAAFNYRLVNDIRVKVQASVGRNQAGEHEVTANVNIDLSRLYLSVENGKRKGTIDIITVAGPERSQYYQRADIDLAEDVYQKLIKTGLPYKAQFRASPATRYVKVIVYDYRADLVGSARVVM
jgi:VWFA-related protein